MQLSQDAAIELQTAEGIYLKELDQLKSAQLDLLAEYDGNWDADLSEKASLLLARSFVDEQLKSARKASLSFTMTGFGKELGAAVPELKSMLANAGVAAKYVDDILGKMIDLARDTSLIKKLTNSVVYIALENSTTSKAAAILGASHWQEVNVILDASVAIPYLCSSMFGSSSGRFSRGSNDSIYLLKKKNARLAIPWYYLNECSSHLVAATQYCRQLSEFEDSFCYSQNGYVSHYYKLKTIGTKVPDTLSEFIQCMSPNAVLAEGDHSQTVRRVMQDLQPLFYDYGVGFENVARLDEAYTRDVQIDYSFELKNMKRRKSQNLIDHDVNVLAHVKRCFSTESRKIMCLTWDAVMIKVGKKMSDAGWIVSPVEAADLIQARMNLSDGKLLSLSHQIARSLERPKELGARIVDRAVQLSGEKMADWEFRKAVRDFRDQAVSRIDVTQEKFNIDDFDEETDRFLQDQGIETGIPQEMEGEE